MFLEVDAVGRRPLRRLPIRSVLIIGIGRAGGNIVNDIRGLGALDGIGFKVQWIQVNKDSWRRSVHLAQSKVSVVTLTCHHRRLLKQLLVRTDIAILVAGLGGFVGAHNCAVIAECGRSADVPTILLVTMPFAFEGIRVQRAKAALRRLKRRTGLLFRFSNQQLAMEMGADAPFTTVYEVQSMCIARHLRRLLRRWHFE